MGVEGVEELVCGGSVLGEEVNRQKYIPYICILFFCFILILIIFFFEFRVFVCLEVKKNHAWEEEMLKAAVSLVEL